MNEKMPKDYKDSAMLIDIQYLSGSKRTGTPDKLYTIWKDLDTGHKYLNVTDAPTMDIYFEKPEFRDHTHNLTYQRVEKLDKQTVKYKDIPWAIANDIGDAGISTLKNAYETGNYKQLRGLHLHPYVFASDFDIRAFYRIKWHERMENKRVKKLDKAYLDIEADNLLTTGGVHASTCPINAVTIINSSTMEVATFLLMTPDKINGLSNRVLELYDRQTAAQQDIINNMDDFLAELHSMFDDVYGKFTYMIKFYKDEAKMLVHLWQLINKWKADTMGIWNMDFDIPYIIERMEALGLDPVQYMCPDEFPVKKAYYKKDNQNFNVEEKSNYFFITSYTIFVDQMILYAATRKGGNKLRSYKLDYIAEKVLGKKKVDYSEVGSIKYLPYMDFRKFVIYNINDVMLLHGIEEATGDIDGYYYTSYQNATPYESVFKSVPRLRNAQYISYLEQGLIPGNNMNIFNQATTTKSKRASSEEDDEEEEGGFEGALVADPVYNDYIGLDLFGKPTNNIFELVIDMDMSRFYPSSIEAMNIEPSCLIFKAIVPVDQFVGQDALVYRGIFDLPDPGSDIGKMVFDDIQTGNILTIGSKWMNLPTVADVFKKCKAKLGG